MLQQLVSRDACASDCLNNAFVAPLVRTRLPALRRLLTSMVSERYRSGTGQYGGGWHAVAQVGGLKCV